MGSPYCRQSDCLAHRSHSFRRMRRRGDQRAGQRADGRPALDDGHPAIVGCPVVQQDAGHRATGQPGRAAHPGGRQALAVRQAPVSPPRPRRSRRRRCETAPGCPGCSRARTRSRQRPGHAAHQRRRPRPPWPTVPDSTSVRCVRVQPGEHRRPAGDRPRCRPEADQLGTPRPLHVVQAEGDLPMLAGRHHVGLGPRLVVGGLGVELVGARIHVLHVGVAGPVAAHVQGGVGRRGADLQPALLLLQREEQRLGLAAVDRQRRASC